MEIFLWLWFFESQFFFNIKSTLQFFKNAWLLPIVLHLFLIITCFYYLFLGYTQYYCDISYLLWILFKLIFSLVFLGFLIGFHFYINNFEEKEKENFHNSSKFFKHANAVNKICDNWIKKKGLISPLGQIIFFLGILNFLFSIFIIFYKSYNDNEECEEKLKHMLFWHGIFIICTNSLVLVCCIILIFFKLIPMLFNYLCPGFNTSLRGKLGKRKIDYSKYIDDYNK